MVWEEYAGYCYGQDNRVCVKPTAYAGARGVWTYPEELAQLELERGYDRSYAIGSGQWLLRSPGECSGNAAFVDPDGGVGHDCGYVSNNYGVRPALKVTY